mmetsp:Transcript_56507/g.123850  ORF Transcript_56507/g.123850 Transcript_56507/m.123850 type:complete len:460 (+) Transcript_56507:75-1454(+)
MKVIFLTLVPAAAFIEDILRQMGGGGGGFQFDMGGGGFQQAGGRGPPKWPKGVSDKITKKMNWMKGTEWNWNNWRMVKFHADGKFEAPTQECQHDRCRWSASKQRVYILWGEAGLHTLKPSEMEAKAGVTMTGKRHDGEPCEAKFNRIFDDEHLELEKDVYEVLGLADDADDAAIKKAYRKLSIKYHPDKATEEGAREKFNEIRDAYEILNDPEKKILFDTGGMAAVKELAKGEVQKGQDSHMTLSASLEDMYNGNKVNARITRRVVCRFCAEDQKPDKPSCQACGRCPDEIRMVNRQVGPGFFVQQQEQVASKHKCRQDNTLIEATIEKGMHGGQTLKFPYMSEQTPGQIPGSVILKLKQQEQSKFRREGDDLHQTIAVPLKEALLGFKRSFMHLDGREVFFQTNGVTKPYQVIQLKGEGMPKYNFPSEFGDMFVTIKVSFPDKLSTDQQDAVGKLFA